ncbi:MAG: hypothetical protein IJ368_03945 [Oscillospiraceae bacterium]|nr:hypothetical protein [Oscillospiraceae bacterium]
MRILNRLSLVNIPLKTPNGNYNDFAHLSVDGVPVPFYINECVKRSQNERLISECSRCEELACAWSPELDFPYCDYFMTEILRQHRDMTIPYLLCPEDCDFSCITITVDVRFEKSFVYLDKIGLADYASHIERKWTSENSLSCRFILPEHIKANVPYEIEEVFGTWEDERLHSLRYELFPFWQETENIITIAEPHWKFDRHTFEEIIAFYQAGNHMNATIPNDLKG